METMIPRVPGEMVTLETRGLSHEKVDKQRRYRQIIKVLTDCGDMTAKEIAWELYKHGEIPSDERNYTAPRLTELSQKGIVEPVGKKRCFDSGKMVTVYSLRDTEAIHGSHI